MTERLICCGVEIGEECLDECPTREGHRMMFRDTTDRDKDQLREVRDLDLLSVINRIEDVRQVYEPVEQFKPASRMLTDIQALLRDAELLVDMTIDKDRDRVAALWPFSSDNYPQLQTTIPAALRHVILHITKDAGRMAGAVEPADHGTAIDSTLILRSTRNMLVNALRLCSLMGIQPSALLDDYYREMEKK